MKVAELFEAVAKLGFEDSLEDASSFYHAANRALLQVNDLRPLISTVTVNHRPPRNLLSESGFEAIERTEELTFSASNALAYYFEVDGKGECHVEHLNSQTGKWDDVERIEFNTSRFTAESGLIPPSGERLDGEIRLRFLGEYAYFIRSVALYGVLYGPTPENILAYEEYSAYDMTDITDDFLAFCEYPITVGGKTVLEGYEVEGGHVILLPRSSPGIYRIRYKRRPMELVYTENALEDEREIDLEGALVSLLPPLIASYIWLDDEPEKAAFYLELYRERVALFERYETGITPLEYRTNGW